MLRSSLNRVRIIHHQTPRTVLVNQAGMTLHPSSMRHLFFRHPKLYHPHRIDQQIRPYLQRHNVRTRASRPSRIFEGENVLYGIIGANVGVFALWRILPWDVMTKHFTVSRDGLMRHLRLHTLVSSTLSHVDFNHLLGNMITLYFFGQSAVWRLGGPQFLALVVVGGSLSSFMQSLSSPQRSLGASGAVNAVVAFMICAAPTSTIMLYFVLPVPAALFGLVYIGKDVVGLLYPESTIGHASHLTGAVYGALTYWMYRRGTGIFRLMNQPLDHCQMSIRQLKAKGMGRYELLQWLNKFLETDYSKIEDLADGIAYVQIFDAVHPQQSFLGQLNFEAQYRPEFERNLELFQRTLHHCGVSKELNVSKLADKVFHEHLELLLWCHDYIRTHSPNIMYDYRAYDRRQDVILHRVSSEYSNVNPNLISSRTIRGDLHKDQLEPFQQSEEPHADAEVSPCQVMSSMKWTHQCLERLQTRDGLNLIVQDLSMELTARVQDHAYLMQSMEELEAQRDQSIKMLLAIETLMTKSESHVLKPRVLEILFQAID